MASICSDYSGAKFECDKATVAYRGKGLLNKPWLRLKILCLFAIFYAPLAVADSACGACHAKEVALWQQSHHAKAMLPATQETVAGVFDGSVTHYKGLAFRFTIGELGYQVSIGEGATAETYAIDYVFGFTPLQQYLARLPRGRYQAIPVAWDARPPSEGGQRWYALASDLNWDHPGFTWNTSCASCHSTNLVKAYDPTSDSFATSFDEVNVSCAACHGDAKAHLAWAAGAKPNTLNAGFAASLKDGGQWAWHQDQAIASRESPPVGAQLSSCAQCHTRSEQIGSWHPKAELFDHVSPVLPHQPFYYQDGQIRDEVFELGSFLQSRMHAAGVVCSNCHEPHSAKLRAEGDGVCMQCHKADTFAVPSHHRHQASSAGCVDCHMPATVYMGVDARRDHRFVIPDPALSKTLGSPDACRSCHAEMPMAKLAERLPKVASPSQIKTRDFATLADGGAANMALYQSIVDTLSPIREASLLAQLSPYDYAQQNVLLSKLQSPSPLVRAAGVRAFAQAPSAERWRRLSALLADNSKMVRMELAPVLAGTAPAQLSQAQSAQLAALFAEYESLMNTHLDSPQIAANFANYQLARGRMAEAAELYQQAIKLDAAFVYPYLQLAMLTRGSDEELNWLQDAQQADVKSADAAYQLGLYWVRAKDYARALAGLKQAFDLAPHRPEFAYGYAVALENRGQLDEAITVLTTVASRGHASPLTSNLLSLYLQKRSGRDAGNVLIK